MLAAIVFTDVVGFSALMGRNEAKAMAMVERDFRIITQIAMGHGGSVLKRTGDGLLISFPSAVEAVQAAIETQKTLSENSQRMNFDDVLVHRVGIHLGDVMVTEHDVLGDGVNVAQRLQAEARPGAICLSQTIVDVIKGKVDVSPVRLGPRSLKGIIEPVIVWEVPPSGVHSTANHLTATAPRDMGEFKLNLEEEPSRARGLLTFLGIILAVTVPISLGVWMVQREATFAKERAKIEREQKKQKEAALEAKRNETPPTPSGTLTTGGTTGGTQTPVPPNQPTVDNQPAEELPDPAKAAQDLTQQNQDVWAQVSQLRENYEFEKCAQVLTDAGFDKAPAGVAVIRHYRGLSRFMQWVDGAVSGVSESAPLKFPGQNAGEETFVWGQAGQVVIKRPTGQETKLLRTMSADAILKLARALLLTSPSTPRERQGVRMFAREFGQALEPGDQN